MAPGLPSSMLALRLTPPATLSLAYTPVAIPSETQHLIRVCTTAPTRDELTWPETLARSRPIPCHDLVGTIVSEPRNGKSKFRIGDTVYGLLSFSRDGCAAEYTVAEPEELSLKPECISDVEAAAIPLSALSAWQALFVHGEMKAGDRVLVLGASGSVGVMAVQLAKAKGGVVTATCSAKNTDFVKALGADFVVSSSHEQDLEEIFDLVIDCVGVAARSKAWEKMKGGGALISIACPMKDEEVPKGKRGSFFIVEASGAQLDKIADIIRAKELNSVVDSEFALEQGPEAFAKLEKGHMKGKIVIKLPNEGEI
ncbi:hypothetical protein ACLMJK_008768 [Lecanora helva]